jgi:hypothetical protein
VAFVRVIITANRTYSIDDKSSFSLTVFEDFDSCLSRKNTGQLRERYSLFEGKHVRKIVDAKAHGIGYLMNPIPRKPDNDEDQFAVLAMRFAE